MVKEEILERISEGEVRVLIDYLETEFYEDCFERNSQSIAFMMAGHQPLSKKMFSFEKVRLWAESNKLLVKEDERDPSYLIFLKK